MSDGVSPILVRTSAAFGDLGAVADGSRRTSDGDGALTGARFS
jgi:hypothetical protein